MTASGTAVPHGTPARQRPLRTTRRGAGLTPAQNGKYWREWAAVRRMLITKAGMDATEADAERHAIQERELGYHKTHAAFTDAEFDRVLGAFAAISDPANLDRQLELRDGPRKRLLFGIVLLVNGRPGYAEEICEDCFGHRDWSRLPEEHLEQLRMTLARRIERRKKELPKPKETAAAAAGAAAPPATSAPAADGAGFALLDTTHGGEIEDAPRHERNPTSHARETIIEFPARQSFMSAWLKGNPPSNVWLGTTIENQEYADRRILELLGIPARVRFLSCEPLLGAVNLEAVEFGNDTRQSVLTYTYMGLPYSHAARIDWVIAGGESGGAEKRRPCEIEWFQSLADQCAAARVPFFMKQDAAAKSGEKGRIPDKLWKVKQFPAAS